MTRYDIWDHREFDCIRNLSILISSHVLSDSFRRKMKAAVKVSGDCMTRMEEISMLLSMNQDHGARKQRNVHLDSKFVA